MSVNPSAGHHIGSELLTAYGAGSLPEPRADAVEAHLLHCAACRDAFTDSTSRVEPARTEAMWASIADAIDRPTRWNRSSAWVRLAVGTPVLLLTAFVLAVLFMAVPLVIALGDERAAITWFLALAPAIPVLGALVAYAAASDPAGELAAAAPLQTFRIVVIRTTVVLTALLPAGLMTSLLLPARATLLLGWFLPALGLCAVVLAVGTRHDPRFVAGGLATAWAVAVGANLGRMRHQPLTDALEQTAVNSAATQLVAVLTIAVAVGYLALHHDDLDRRTA